MHVKHTWKAGMGGWRAGWQGFSKKQRSSLAGLGRGRGGTSILLACRGRGLRAPSALCQRLGCPLCRIVRLLGIFEIDNNTFATVLELCEGGDLDAHLKLHEVTVCPCPAAHVPCRVGSWRPG
jgi:hypothetical protein